MTVKASAAVVASTSAAAALVRTAVVVMLLLAGLALGLIAPSSALAEAPAPQDRKDALRFAEAYWNERGYDAADEGCLRVNTILYRGNGNTFGYTIPARYCSIWLNVNAGWKGDGNRAAWWTICATVIHEYGHLLGKGHNRNPESIMSKLAADNYLASWYPWFPDCRYDGDDPDGDGYPDW